MKCQVLKTVLGGRQQDGRSAGPSSYSSAQTTTWQQVSLWEFYNPSRKLQNPMKPKTKKRHLEKASPCPNGMQWTQLQTESRLVPVDLVPTQPNHGPETSYCYQRTSEEPHPPMALLSHLPTADLIDLKWSCDLTPNPTRRSSRVTPAGPGTQKQPSFPLAAGPLTSHVAVESVAALWLSSRTIRSASNAIHSGNWRIYACTGPQGQVFQPQSQM